jgi:hypothetical protein
VPHSPPPPSVVTAREADVLHHVGNGLEVGGETQSRTSAWYCVAVPGFLRCRMFWNRVRFRGLFLPRVTRACNLRGK